MAIVKEREEAGKQKFEEKDRVIGELQGKLQEGKEELNQVKLEVKKKQLEIEELEMQGFEKNYNL